MRISGESECKACVSFLAEEARRMEIRLRLPSREFLRSCFAGLPTKLHWVFLFPAILLVIFLALWTPPFQSADEFAHFDRAWQVAHGQPYATSGGFIDAGAEELYAYSADLPFHTEARFSPANRARAEAVKWTGRLSYYGFPNTRTCAPTCYLPQALGIVFGEAAGMGSCERLCWRDSSMAHFQSWFACWRSIGAGEAKW
jgi:hypothetical protein